MRAVATLAVVTIAVPLIGFLILGDVFEDEVAEWVQAAQSPGVLWGSVAASLAVDLFLPIPSSVVLTYAGQVLGVWATTLAGVLGLTVSSELGYWLGRCGGRPIAERFGDAAEFQRLETRSTNSSLWWVVLSRPLPLIAEAVTLAAGVARVSHGRFFLTVLVANAWVSATFATLGAVGRESWQWPTLIASAVVPLGITWALKARSKRDGE